MPHYNDINDLNHPVFDGDTVRCPSCMAAKISYRERIVVQRRVLGANNDETVLIDTVYRTLPNDQGAAKPRFFCHKCHHTWSANNSNNQFKRGPIPAHNPSKARSQ